MKVADEIGSEESGQCCGIAKNRWNEILGK
jgi:hypothetical protein